MDWRRFFEVNVLTGVRLSRHYIGRMKQKNWGRIVLISSESALQIPVEMIHYRRAHIGKAKTLIRETRYHHFCWLGRPDAALPVRTVRPSDGLFTLEMPGYQVHRWLG